MGTHGGCSESQVQALKNMRVIFLLAVAYAQCPANPAPLPGIQTCCNGRTSPTCTPDSNTGSSTEAGGLGTCCPSNTLCCSIDGVLGQADNFLCCPAGFAC